MSDVPETQHHEPERVRLTALGRRTDNRNSCEVLAIRTPDGSWVVYGPGTAGVCLSNDVMVT